MPCYYEDQDYDKTCENAVISKPCISALLKLQMESQMVRSISHCNLLISAVNLCKIYKTATDRGVNDGIHALCNPSHL
jgi:hypothetical protein